MQRGCVPLRAPYEHSFLYIALVSFPLKGSSRAVLPRVSFGLFVVTVALCYLYNFFEKLSRCRIPSCKLPTPSPPAPLTRGGLG